MAPTSLFAGLVARDESPEQTLASQTHFKTYYIIGIVIAVLLVVSIAVWLVIRRYRKLASYRREREANHRALNVRGLMRDNDHKKTYSVIIEGDNFVQSNLTESSVQPETASKNEIIEHYEAEGRLPRPFAPFMGDAEKLAPPPPSPTDDTSSNRLSTASWVPMGRNSFLGALGNSRRSSVASFKSTTSATSRTGSTVGKDKRLIRQMFNPVLPDELVVSIGERFTVITSHDDGWCIVGRDSIFKPGEVEIGAIPAWCFIKPVAGLHAERPMRTSSLGVTVKLDEPSGPGLRDNVMSWSNF